ncbi:pyridoxal phosphate-dependent aminotransferase [Marinicella sp. S1101]|uniref:pyridoxal phosphate-dependent aminotransferase n=1 Tax=Marinicella marina TaxID=2996016 RepID=UPI002260DDB2|nr:pyridoxal phosphate-dependent aminotransferase [Marinicella marina]MCX7553806.1 pyridoxal phosphate-dependent aminotransferase [Marinicella marina]
MAAYSKLAATHHAHNLHSSNPQPLNCQGLSELIGVDLTAAISQMPFGYESTQGRESLRSLLATELFKSTTADEISLTCGAQEGIFVVMQTLLSAGDEVIAFTPSFEPLITEAQMTGATVKTIPLIQDQGWHIDWQLLEKSFSARTKMLIINFPHNPTGTHINAEELNRLIDLCRSNNSWLVSDEVFRGLEHDESQRLMAASDLYQRAISMGVMSKSYAMPGIRLGWIACRNPEVMQQINTIKAHLSICQSAADAQLAEAILPHTQIIWKYHVKIINENKHWLHGKLQQHPELSWHLPKAAATGFVQFKRLNADTTIKQWAEELQLMVMPNAAFCTETQGFRITLGQKNSQASISQLLNWQPQAS